MQDRFYFGTNTKMFKTAAETVDYLRRLEELTHGIPPERAQRLRDPLLHLAWARAGRA